MAIGVSNNRKKIKTVKAQRKQVTGSIDSFAQGIKQFHRQISAYYLKQDPGWKNCYTGVASRVQ